MEYRIDYTNWEQENFLKLFHMLQNNPNTKLVLYCGEAQEKKDEVLEKTVGAYLNLLGVARHLKGYGYLKCGVLNCIHSPEDMESVTKVLYPKIARNFHTTPGKVEHAIRHAIKRAWEGEKSKEWDSIFGKGYLKRNLKPTNAEFIAVLSDFITINN